MLLNKQAKLVSPKKIDICFENIDEQNLGAREVIVEVAYCGICGSDMPRYFEGKVHFYPLVLGHEFSGTVVAKGSDVALSVGDKVSCIPLEPCMECEFCKKGRYQLCKKYKFVGSRRDGGFQKYVRLSERNLIKLSPSTDLKDAAFIEPITVAIHGYKLVKNYLQSESEEILIYGFGNIGIILTEYLLFKGYKNINVLTRSSSRRELAKNIGIKNFYVESDLPNINQKFSVIFDCSSNEKSMEILLQMAAEGGALSIIGTKNADLKMTAKTFNLIQREELSIFGSWMSYSSPWPGFEWTEAVKALGAGAFTLQELIKAVFTLDNVNDGFSKAYEVGQKILIKVN